MAKCAICEKGAHFETMSATLIENHQRCGNQM